jgi:transcription initiation factor IIE alpha subunit
MTMQCPNGHGDMVLSDVTFERRTPQGSVFRMVVSGFRCLECGEEMMMVDQLRQVSREWKRFLAASTDISDSVKPIEAELPRVPALPTVGSALVAA